ncbi:MAG: hypothetical protein ABSB22_04450 [Thermodesulfobacteriota bacterium]|jgi:hypothetical protein
MDEIDRRLGRRMLPDKCYRKTEEITGGLAIGEHGEGPDRPHLPLKPFGRGGHDGTTVA